MKYEKLFTPGKLGSMTVKNRIVMPPMGTGMAAADGEASDQIIRYYEERAKGGVGMIITEITRVDEEYGWGLARQLAVTKPGMINGLQKLVDTVHKYGTKILIQLHHPGREGHARLNPGKAQIIAPSAFTTPRCDEMPRELTIDEIKAVIAKYITGAVVAKNSGADGVEIHAAHGYFINQWLSPFSNRRTDEYGGCFENRMRFITEVIYGIRKFCGPDFHIGVRLSVDEMIGDEGLTIKDGVEIAKYLEKIGVNHIHCSVAIYESGYNIIPAYVFPQAPWKQLTKAIKAAVNIPVISINNIKEPAVAEQLLQEGICDFVAVGRGQLADPEWANKARRGDDMAIRKCIGCCRCIDAISYGKHMECSVNPRLGRELELQKPEKVGCGRTVAVIGGGPAGMQAAKVLAQKEYKVVLFESNPYLGGALYLASKNVLKEKLGWLIDTMAYELDQLGVEIRLSTTATVESVKALNPCGVFVCCGGTHIEPKIPGIDSAKAVRVKDYLEKGVEVGKRVAVIGSGATGIETAATLATRGHEVTVIEMLPNIGTGVIARVLGVLVARLNKMGVKLMPGHKLTAITDTGITVQKMVDGSSLDMEFDSVILALGIAPQTQYAEEFAANFENAYVIGDTVKSATALEAIKVGNDYAWVFEG